MIFNKVLLFILIFSCSLFFSCNEKQNINNLTPLPQLPVDKKTGKTITMDEYVKAGYGSFISGKYKDGIAIFDDIIKIQPDPARIITTDKNASFYIACYEGNKNFINSFPDAKFNPEKESFLSPLHMAVMGKQKDIVELLISKGADVNFHWSCGETPLHGAAFTGNTEIIELLISKGANVKAVGITNETPLHVASRFGNKEAAEILIKHGADINAIENGGWTPMLWSSYGGHDEVTKLLIENGADLFALAGDFTMRCPLDFIVMNGNKELIEWLILRKNNNFNGEYGKASMAIACQHGKMEIARWLIEKGINVNAKIYGSTFLHNAVDGENKEIIELLINNGAKVNAKDKESRTPLHYAVDYGVVIGGKIVGEKKEDETIRIEIIKLLISRGGNVNAVDGFGRTPLSIAKVREIKELLIKHGAK